MKKNCNNCEHLEWVEAEVADPSGFDCLKRNDCTLSEKDEDILHANLTRDSYREKAKVCHDPKAI